MADDVHKQIAKLAKRLGCDPTGNAVLKASLKLAKETLKAIEKADRKPKEWPAGVFDIKVKHAKKPVRLTADAAVEAIEKDLIDTLAEAGSSPTGRSVFDKPVFADFTDIEKRAAAHIVGVDFGDPAGDMTGYALRTPEGDIYGEAAKTAYAMNAAETGAEEPRKVGHYVHLLGKELFEKSRVNLKLPTGIPLPTWETLSEGDRQDWLRQAQLLTLYGIPPADTSDLEQLAALAGWKPIDTAPTDGTIVEVYAPAREGLNFLVLDAAYTEAGGWTVDEVRHVTHWRPKASVELSEARQLAETLVQDVLKHSAGGRVRLTDSQDLARRAGATLRNLADVLYATECQVNDLAWAGYKHHQKGYAEGLKRAVTLADQVDEEGARVFADGHDIADEIKAELLKFDASEPVRATDVPDLAAENATLRARVESLEALRPHWAQGFSSDGVAAQVQTTALNQLWTLLGVSDQTAAVAALKKLTEKGAPLPDLAFLRHVDSKSAEGVNVNWMIEHHKESWEAAKRLSDAGMLAIEQRPTGGRLHVTNLGRKRLIDSEV
jgi:hypothetical protein